MVATMPVAAVTLEIFLDGRKMTKWFLFGVVLVLVGGFIASGRNLKSDNIGFASFLELSGVGYLHGAPEQLLKTFQECLFLVKLL
jgi:drug/metabolite transporter (DMT)-like permease